ncbi:MAG: hypothetical protein RR449_03080, partial [Christensenella sp.]
VGLGAGVGVGLGEGVGAEVTVVAETEAEASKGAEAQPKNNATHKITEIINIMYFIRLSIPYTNVFYDENL